jgi:hypothetical protein
MKIIVTHISPDWDAIGSVWLIRKYLDTWRDAEIKFVPAGERLPVSKLKVPSDRGTDVIEKIGEDEVMHVDTGMGPLDHHQTSDRNVCGMSKTWDYVQRELEAQGKTLTSEHLEAVGRIVKVVVDIDHFGEVFWKDVLEDYHEFSLLGILEGLKYMRQYQDAYYAEFGFICLNALLAEFENRIWAEKEITGGQKFDTRYGRGIGFETINDSVLKLAQKMGFVIVVRKDPRKGYVRIKTLPEIPPKIPPAPFNKGGGHDGAFPKGGEEKSPQPPLIKGGEKKKGADLSLVYEKFKKIDPDATWYLHVSGKMLLNGTPKNPKMKPTKLGLDEIIKVLEKI